MRDRLAVLTLAALIGALWLGPLAQSVAAQAQAPGLTLPAVSGSLARGGQFSGSLTITRLTNRAGQLVADGVIVGTVAAENGAPSTPTPAVVNAPASGGTIFASTSTPFATTEPYSVTATSTATATPAAATPTPTATVELGAIVTSTTSPGDEFPRVSLPDERLNQATTPSAAVSQSFREIPLTLADPDMGACDYLQLDLGVVFVDQLGVQLDLAPATIDLAALPRANRPLGGLLCTVASLLDLGPGSTQAAMLNELLPVVNRALSTASR